MIKRVTQHEMFPVTVMGFRLAGYRDWNPQLKQVIRQAQQADAQGLIMTNQGGWHSAKSLHRTEDPSVQALLRHIRQSLSEWALVTFDLEKEPEVDKWDIELWANVNGRGHFNKAHDHFRSGVIASGCYYLQTNGRKGEGRIVFINQQSVPKFIESAVLPRRQSFAITPKDGQSLIFPSWLGHWVEAHSCEGERISLAFNAGHPDLQVRRKGDRLVRQGLTRMINQYFPRSLRSACVTAWRRVSPS